MYPSNAEVCDGKDNNCNGGVDEEVKTTYFVDNDDDGYGSSNSVLGACSKPAGYVDKAGDCNDFNPQINPGAAEQCNGIDDNCNGAVDDGIQQVSQYWDGDHDGHGASTAAAVLKCLKDGKAWPDYSLIKDDCDDSDSTKFPGGVEVCDDKDNDCDGLVDTQCATDCPGTWPVQMPITSHMTARLLDYNGDSIEELYIIDSSGKLKQITLSGAVTTICNSLTFATGYGNKFTWTVNPALGSWKYYFVQGTRIYDLDTCKQVKGAR